MTTPALATFRASNAILGRVAPNATARRIGRLFTTPRPRPLRPWEESVEVGATRLQLATGLSALHWSGPGHSILAMHGWEGRATQFGPMSELLTGRGASVLALDGPAHGRSQGTRANPVAFARALLDADRERGPFDAFIGHSMGAAAGAVAIAWGLRVDHAVLIAAPASLPGVLHRFAQFVHLPQKATAVFVRELEAAAGVPAAEIAIDAIAEQVAVPTLVIHDADDLDVPVDEGRRMADMLESATYMETVGLGHNRILRNPEVMRRVADFLTA